MSTDILLDPEEEHAGDSGPTPLEKAFRRSGEMEFRGEKLYPFSFRRETAAQALGLRYYRLNPGDLYTVRNPNKELLKGTDLTPEQRAEIEQQPEGMLRYNGLVYDAAIVLWLCSQPDDVVKKVRKRPEDFEDEIDAWAEANGVHGGGEHLAEATLVFCIIMADVAASAVKVESKEASTGPKP